MSTDRGGRLHRLSHRLRAEGFKPLVPFVTAGYPDETQFTALMGVIAAAGCPLVEIGIPFSDPVADGPVIQAASQQVLAQGMTLRRTLELAAAAHRDHGLHVVLMGYLNPILSLGPNEFAAACEEARIAGVIIPDLPPEEASGLDRLLAAKGTDLVNLVAPTTDPARLKRHLSTASGFVYLISTNGVTGDATANATDLPAYVARVRRATSLPLYVGFGLSRPEQAAQVAAAADGAIVGSALLRILASSHENSVGSASEFITAMAQAMATEKGSC